MTDPLDPAVTLLTQGAHAVRQTPEVPAPAPQATEPPDEIDPVATLHTHGAQHLHPTPAVPLQTFPATPTPHAATHPEEVIKQPSVNDAATHDPEAVQKQESTDRNTNNQAHEITNQPDLPADMRQTGDHEPALQHTLDMPVPKARPGLAAKPLDQNYEIIKELGKGGMGIVYLARQKSIGRIVALKKILDKSYGDTDRLKATLGRFRTEAEVLGRIQHPNIIQVYDYGTNEDSLPFFALEFCRGGDLHDALKNRQVEPKQAARLMLVLASAMSAAHKAGIVHRDLKPQNVLLTEPCADINTLNPNFLKIADFGLARNTDATDKLHETVENQAMGTWLYMAPEQAENAAGAGPPADIYALGVVLYEMITGRLPLVAKTTTEMKRLLTDVDPQPIAAFSRNCPADLETICLKCLRKNTRNRYRTADAFAEDLQAFLDFRPISARPVGQAEKAWMWMVRNPGRSIAMGASLLLGILIVLGSIVVAREKIYSANMKLEDERKLQQQALSNEKQLRENDLRAEQDKSRVQIMSLLDRLTSATTAPEGIGDIISQIDMLALKVNPVVIDNSPQDSKILTWGHLHNWNSYDLREYLVQSTPLARSRIKLAMLPSRPDFAAEVGKDAIGKDAGEMPVYSTRLKPFASMLTETYWQELLDSATDLKARLRLGVMLAAWNPTDNRWPMAGRALTASLVDLDVLELNPWLKLLEPIRAHLFKPLEEFFLAASAANASKTMISRGEAAARIIAAKADNPELLAMAASRATDSQFGILAGRMESNPSGLIEALDRITRKSPRGNVLGEFLTSLVPLELEPPADNARDRISRVEAKIQTMARAICSLAFLDKPDRLWQALARNDLPGLQSELRHTVVPYRVPLLTLVNRYVLESKPVAKRNLVLLMGSYADADLTKACDSSISDMFKDFENHPDPGLHAALDWLIRWRLGNGGKLDVIVKSLAKKSAPAGTQPGWRVNSHGQTMTMVPSGSTYRMGSGPDDPDRVVQLGYDIELRHDVTIQHGFEISQHEITVGEFRQFRKNYVSLAQVGSEHPETHDSEPAVGISWFDAMAYCHWLNTNEDSIDIRSNMKIPTRFVEIPGYRLPTEEEWELAARADNDAPYPCGYGTRWLSDHAVTWNNANDRCLPCGRLFPNAWGLSDTSGNALEWVMDDFRRYNDQTVPLDRKLSPQREFMVIAGDSLRVVRGGSYSNSPTAARNSARLMARADQRAASSGFRICRTTTTVSPKPIKTDSAGN